LYRLENEHVLLTITDSYENNKIPRRNSRTPTENLVQNRKNQLTTSPVLCMGKTEKENIYSWLLPTWIFFVAGNVTSNFFPPEEN
jgi:hypothetical protein